MKIMNLNVNNFGGIRDKKPQWKDFKPLWREYRLETRLFQGDQKRRDIVEALACAIRTEMPDIVIFQEFDINAPAGKEAIRPTKSEKSLKTAAWDTLTR